MRHITVVGGGGTGLMLAADLTLRGHRVTLFEREDQGENLRAVLEEGCIHRIGQGLLGNAVLHRITFDADEALAEAEYVFVAAMTPRHEELCRLLAPRLRDGQTVCFSAGNCAAIQLRRLLDRKVRVLVGEMQGNAFPCRVMDRAVVTAASPYKVKKVAAFPACDNEAFAASLSQVYECVCVKDVFETCLNSPNVSIHLAASLLGVAKMESMEDFRLYRDGVTPSVVKLVAAVEEEKVRVVEAMGYTATRALGTMVALLDPAGCPHLADFRLLAGPDKIDHRYFFEDAGTGNSLLVSLADRLGEQVPVMRGLIAAISAIHGADYLSTGITLESLGMGDMSLAEIGCYLEHGASSAV